MQRREFIASTVLGALSMSFSKVPTLLNDNRMGIVVHSYASRWNSKTESKNYPGFKNAIELIEHCYKIKAGGVQVGVKDWSNDFSKQVRDAREKLGLYLEGSIGLPKNQEDVSNFEKEVIGAKEAGATILRTVCMNGRRYENLNSWESFQTFKKEAIHSIQLAEPIVRKHKMKLAIENHKDWRADELAAIIKEINSEWVGVTIDFGNSVALMEDPMNVVNTLAPYVFSTHVKDMGVEEYKDGFLLSEVPLGLGMLDLPAMVSICKKHNPDVKFSLEMITRDPLEIPCLIDTYWPTFNGLKAQELARTLRMVKEHHYPTPLPRVSQLTIEERLVREEDNNVACLAYSRDNLGLN